MFSKYISFIENLLSKVGLNENVINAQNKNGMDIYVPYTLMPKFETCQALLVYAKQYNMIKPLNEFIQDVNPMFGVYNQMVELENLDKSMESLKELSVFVMVLIALLSVPLILLIYVKYIAGRKKEIYLLRVNGLRKTELIWLLCLEIGIQTCCICCVTIFFIFVESFLIKGFVGYPISINYIKTIAIVLSFTFLITLIPAICACVIYLFDDPSRMVRS